MTTGTGIAIAAIAIGLFSYWSIQEYLEYLLKIKEMERNKEE